MSQTKLSVLFKKIQKDDKKEVIEFHVQGDELPHSQELVQLAGSIVVLDVENSQAGNFNAEFKSIQRDSKKTTLKFNIKGDSEEKIIKLYPYAGRGVTLALTASQMSIEEFYDKEDHEGIEYKVDKDGTATLASKDQMSIDDVVEEEPAAVEEDDPFEDDSLE